MIFSVNIPMFFKRLVLPFFHGSHIIPAASGLDSARPTTKRCPAPVGDEVRRSTKGVSGNGIYPNNATSFFLGKKKMNEHDD